MEEENREIMPGRKVNVGFTERFISMIAGSFLMYRAIATKRKRKALLGGYLMFRGATGHCSSYSIVGMSTAGKAQNVNCKVRITVNKPLPEVYEFWRRLENFPLFMKHLKSLKTIDDITSEWKAFIPGKLGTVTWKSEIVKDEKNQRIGWHSLPGSSIENAGNVHFRDAGKFGTEVYVVISYHAPGGKAGEGVGKLFNPLFEEMVKEDIKNFKRYMETGELPSIKGQPSGAN